MEHESSCCAPLPILTFGFFTWIYGTTIYYIVGPWYINAPPSPWSSFLSLILITLLFALAGGCAIATIRTPPGKVPWTFASSIEHSNDPTAALIAEEVTICDTCNHRRPPRAHHCSRCGVCVLQLDHHCTLLNACIGLRNFKFFVQTLGYAAAAILTSMFYLVGVIHPGPGTLLYHQSGRSVEPPTVATTIQHIDVYLATSAAAVSGLLLALFFLGQMLLLLQGKTAVEAVAFEGPSPHRDPSAWGAFSQLKSTFGGNVFEWFLPIQHLPHGALFTSCKVPEITVWRVPVEGEYGL